MDFGFGIFSISILMNSFYNHQKGLLYLTTRSLLLWLVSQRQWELEQRKTDLSLFLNISINKIRSVRQGDWCPFCVWSVDISLDEHQSIVFAKTSIHIEENIWSGRFLKCLGFLHVSIAGHIIISFSSVNFSVFRWNGRNRMWSLKTDLTSILTHLSFSTEYVFF